LPTTFVTKAAGGEPRHPVVQLAEGTVVPGPGTPDQRLEVHLGQLGRLPRHRATPEFVTYDC
jgi:hypothetical protein